VTVTTVCPERVLNDTWRVFNSLGITDDLTIVEHLAFLLLAQHIDSALLGDLKEQLTAELQPRRVQSGSSPSPLERLSQRLYQDLDLFPEEQELPAPPTNVPDERLLEILDHLGLALEELTPADLLNHCLLRRLPDRLAGGRYPTPRHIARTMASLVNLGEGESLADLACGSGGLLVAAADKQPSVTGIEISPNWERIARANTVLHNLPTARLRVGNALRVCENILPSGVYGEERKGEPSGLPG